MAKTDDLIDDLVRDLRPVRPGALGRLLAAALLTGLALSAALIFLGHGLRPDLGTAIALPAFWVKSAYPLLLGMVGVGTLLAVARPGGSPARAAVPVALLVALLAVLALLQLQAAATPEESRRLIFGISAWFCPFIILAAGAPLMATSFWFLRRSAPTSPRLAGLTAGLTSGALGAWVYSWGCIETGLPFVALWYSAGIALCAGLGSLLGRSCLRW